MIKKKVAKKRTEAQKKRRIKLAKEKTLKEQGPDYVFGRPTKYKKEMCQQVVDAMAKGYSKEAACAEIGIWYQTMQERVKSRPDFSVAVKRGEQLSALWWEKVGLAATIGKVPGFSSPTWIFNMKNRQGWADKQDVTLGGHVSTSVPLSAKEVENLSKNFNGKF